MDEICPDALSSIFTTPPMLDRLKAIKELSVRNEDSPGVLIAIGEYLKAMVDVSVSHLQGIYPADNIMRVPYEPDMRAITGLWPRLERAGLPFSLARLFAEVHTHLGELEKDSQFSKEEELWKAADGGDLVKIQELSSDPLVNVNYEKDLGGRRPRGFFTPISVAALRGHFLVVEQLLKDPRVKATANVAPVISAVLGGHPRIAHLLLDDPRTDVNVMFDELFLLEICHELGFVELFVRLVGDPRTSFRHLDPFLLAQADGFQEAIAVLGRNPLALVESLTDACYQQSADWIVEGYLGHPRINKEYLNLNDPFHTACENGNVRIVEYLLADPRIVVQEHWGGSTPFSIACLNGHLAVTKVLLASSRDTGIEGCEAGLIEEKGHQEIANLVRRFKTNPSGVRSELRSEFATKLFVVMVFLCDGFLEVGNQASNEPWKMSRRIAKIERFFGIARRLPMDLQMLLCHRVYGSFSKDVISPSSCEPHFRSLAMEFS